MSIDRRALLRWSAGIGLVSVIVLGVDLGGVAKHIAGADSVLIAVGVIGLSAIHLLGAATWRLLVRRLGGLWLPWRLAVTRYYAAQALGSVTPANLGGDAYRVYAVGGAGHPAAASLWPVVMQRATSFAALSLLAWFGLVPLWALAGPAIEIVVLGAIGSLLLVAGVVLVLATAQRRGGLRAGQSRRGLIGAAAVGLLLGIAFHAGCIVLGYLLVLAVAPDAPAVPVLAAVAVARLSIALPLTPSGLGIQEGLLSLMFAGLGMAPAVAVAAMLLSRLALLLTAALGTLALVSARRQGGRTGDRALALSGR
jgi:uncharacterized membrane protein YbhN (UPF0104 family)